MTTALDRLTARAEDMSVQDAIVHTRLCLARVVGPEATVAALRGER